ncbi:MAG: hypothetical protein JWQ02_2679 [Capsulimonas sp.]|jgi:hypothetical protein|nr:hypothetical protein [Capsulimonas sp.]
MKIVYRLDSTVFKSPSEFFAFAGYLDNNCSFLLNRAFLIKKDKEIMPLPTELTPEVYAVWGQMKQLTLLVLRECHDPDYSVTEERANALFNKLESEALQLRLFDE